MRRFQIKLLQLFKNNDDYFDMFLEKKKNETNQPGTFMDMMVRTGLSFRKVSLFRENFSK